MTGDQITGHEVRGDLYEALRTNRSFEEKAQRALELGEQYLGVDNGHLTRIDTETNHWEAIVSTDPPEGQFPPGAMLDLTTTYCRRTIQTDSSISLHDAPNQGWDDDLAFETHGLHCYHGTTLLLDDEPYGTVCFVSKDSRDEAFSEDETMFAELVTRLLERELEREQHEAELTRQANLVNVLNRVLRHNLRNDMSVIRGRVQLMADQLAETQNGETVIRKVDELIELSQKARDLEQIVGQEYDRQTTDITAVVDRVVDRVRTEFPEARFERDVREGVSAAVLGSFERAIEELVENAAKHGGQSPNVCVTVEQVPNAVEIRITDDGPGLSETEQKVLKTGEESPLIHGSGIGLWLVHWIVSSHDGSVEATVTDETTTLMVSIPRVPETESQQHVTELRHARDRYQAAFEEASNAMVIVGDEGVIVEANSEATNIYGLAARELLGRKIPEFLPEEFDFESAWNSFQQTGTEHSTTTVIGADGVDRTVEYSATTDIVPGQHLVIMRDVTERIERERALEKTTQRLEAVTAASPDPIVALDTDGCIQLWNEAAEKLFGCSADEVIGEPLKAVDLHMEKDIAEFEDRFQRALDGETFTDLEVTRQTAEGEPVHLSISTAPLRDADGTITGVMGICRDTTDTIRMKRRYEALSNGFPDLCFVLDEDDVYRDVLSCSSSDGKLYADPEEFLDTAVEDVLPPAESDLLLSKLESTLETDEPQTFEYELEVEVGTRVFEARMARLSERIDGKRAVSCVVRDITDRRESDIAQG